MLITSVYKNFRYIQYCYVDSKFGGRAMNSTVEFIVDTGAPSTVCMADSLDFLLQEEDFSQLNYVYLGGYVSGGGDILQSAVKHYELAVDNFYVGNLNMGRRRLFVTFDERVNTNLLGMDILADLTMLQAANTGRLHISDNICELFRHFNCTNEVQDCVLASGRPGAGADGSQRQQ